MIETLFSTLGLGVLIFRLKPGLSSQQTFEVNPLPLVSIVLPCRNEEQRIVNCLKSLVDLDYSQFEVIVVDDNSTDKTYELAKKFPVKIIKAPPLPKGWTGKNWACWNGALAAQGQYLLFTDADTFHNRDSLKKSVGFAVHQSADMISAPPFHRCEKIYEKVLGLFFLFPLIVTGFRQKPSSGRLYAIGQYMLFKKEKYTRWGGHEAIAGSLVDDIDFAKLCQTSMGRYRVYPFADLYSVQMFSHFSEFIKGWIRLLRLGMQRSSFMSFMEMTLIIHLFAIGLWPLHGSLFILSILGMVVVAVSQKEHGHFPLWTALMAPLSLVLLVTLSGAAFVETSFRRNIVWRNREYGVRS